MRRDGGARDGIVLQDVARARRVLVEAQANFERAITRAIEHGHSLRDVARVARISHVSVHRTAVRGNRAPFPSSGQRHEATEKCAG